MLAEVGQWLYTGSFMFELELRAIQAKRPPPDPIQPGATLFSSQNEPKKPWNASDAQHGQLQQEFLDADSYLPGSRVEK